MRSNHLLHYFLESDIKMILDKFPQLLIATSKASDGNMSFLRGDPKEALENRKKFLSSLGIDINKVIGFNCVHGDQVLRVGKKEQGKGGENPKEAPEVDGLITNEKDIYLFLLTADCLPVTLYDPKTSSIGLIHAGWKGIDNEIIIKAVKKMEEEFKTKPEDLIAQINPSIGPCCYKGFLKVQQIDPKWQKYVHKYPDQTYGLDLWSFAKDQLIQVGINSNNITNLKICSFHNLEYFSHRKAEVEKLENDYRFATVVGLKP